MKKLILLALLFTANPIFSQQNITTSIYVPIAQFKSHYDRPLTKQDTLNFKFKDNDTLVKVIQGFKEKGVAIPYEYKDDTFLNIYESIAFKYSHDSLREKSTSKYWKNDILIYFSKSINKKTKKRFLKFSKEVVAQVDSLNIREVKRVESSNYIVYYAGEYEYLSKIENYKNSDYYISWNRGNQIYSGFLRINSEHNFNESLRLRKMQDLFLKTLGHFNFDKSINCENYFSGCYQPKIKLSELDLELLKYHYSYGICKGTDLKTFEEQHRKAKDILKKHNSRMTFFHPFEKQ